MNVCLPLRQWFFFDLADSASGKVPRPDFIPAMQARRLSTVDKLALFALDNLDADLQEVKTVFASQHGELERTCKIVQQMTTDSDVSPTQFSTSVHNSSSGLFSIATENKLYSTAIAAGDNTLFSALIEAYCQVEQREEDVVIVIADTELPLPLKEFSDSANPGFCVALWFSRHQSEKMLTLYPKDVRHSGGLFQQIQGLRKLVNGQVSEIHEQSWQISID